MTSKGKKKIIYSSSTRQYVPFAHSQRVSVSQEINETSVVVDCADWTMIIHFCSRKKFISTIYQTQMELNKAKRDEFSVCSHEDRVKK